MKNFRWIVLMSTGFLFGIMLSSSFACAMPSLSTDGQFYCVAYAPENFYLVKDNCSYSPSSDPDDGKFLTVAGNGLETLAGTKIIAFIGIIKGQLNFTLGIFDGDQGGSWDITKGTPDELFFTLYPDPLKNGTTTVAMDRLSSYSMTDDSWFKKEYSVGTDAKAPSGNFFYRLEVQWRDTTISDDLNSFKLMVNGQISLSMEKFGFVGAPLNNNDSIVGSGDPNPGEINDPNANSYDGNWSFYFYLPHDNDKLTITEGDADCGNDTDSLETLNVDPDGAGPAQAEGAYPGVPADDNTTNSGCRIPGNVEYMISTPNNTVYTNYNPSGNLEWENWTIYSTFVGGIYAFKWMYVDAHNAIYIQPPFELFSQPMVPLPIENIPPAAEAGLNITAKPNSSVSFNGSASYDPDGTIISYIWDFGDGTIGSGPVSNHVYTYESVFIVHLTVTDDCNVTGTDSCVVIVVNQLPVAEAGADKQAGIKISVQFDGRASYDPDGIIIDYLWDFGDGTGTRDAVVSHSYSRYGTYIAILTVIDDCNASGSDTCSITILNKPPVAEAGPNINVQKGLVAIFDASKSYDLDGVIVLYMWNFGDGGTAWSKYASHVYSSVGSYVVVLTVIDNCGASNSDTLTVIVSSNLIIAEAGPDQVGTVFTDFVFGNSTMIDSGLNAGCKQISGTTDNPNDYLWIFSDGLCFRGSTVSRKFEDKGIFNVVLIITDKTGVKVSDTATILVENIPPVVQCQGDVLGTTGIAYTFSSLSSFDPDGIIVDYIWDFGDGSIGSGVTVQHIYSVPGIYLGELRIMDNDGVWIGIGFIASISSINSIDYNENSPHTLIPISDRQEPKSVNNPNDFHPIGMPEKTSNNPSPGNGDDNIHSMVLVAVTPTFIIILAFIAFGVLSAGTKVMKNIQKDKKQNSN